MNNIITLPNGRIFDLSKDDLTTEDYKVLSGEEVRHIRQLQDLFIKQKWVEEQKECFKGRVVGIF